MNLRKRVRARGPYLILGSIFLAAVSAFAFWAALDTPFGATAWDADARVRKVVYAVMPALAIQAVTVSLLMEAYRYRGREAAIPPTVARVSHGLLLGSAAVLVLLPMLSIVFGGPPRGDDVETWGRAGPAAWVSAIVGCSLGGGAVLRQAGSKGEVVVFHVLLALGLLDLALVALATTGILSTDLFNLQAGFVPLALAILLLYARVLRPLRPMDARSDAERIYTSPGNAP